MDVSMSSSGRYCIWKLNLDRNQTRMVARRIMVPAFFTKDIPLSPMLFKTSIGRGIWYAGSSITKGAGCPANIFVFFNTIPENTMAQTPRK